MPQSRSRSNSDPNLSSTSNSKVQSEFPYQRDIPAISPSVGPSAHGTRSHRVRIGTRGTDPTDFDFEHEHECECGDGFRLGVPKGQVDESSPSGVDRESDGDSVMAVVVPRGQATS